MDKIEIKEHRTPITPLNVVVLLLMIFNSGGIKVVDHFYITIVTLALLTLKLSIDGKVSLLFLLRTAAFSLALLLFNLVITKSWGGVKEYTVMLSYLLTAAWLFSSYRSSRAGFINDLYLALLIVLLHSIASFLLQFIVKPFTFHIDDERVSTFYYLFFYMFEDGKFVSRNLGMFWEPGVLQIYLNILIYVSLFIRKNLWVATLGAIGVLTTFSTTGYLVLFIIITAAFIKEIRRSYFAIAAMILLVPIVLAAVSANVYDKFTGENAKSASVRMFDMVVGTSLLMDHPVAGVGLDQNLYKETFYSYGIDKIKDFGIADYELEGKGITNSVLFAATAFGLPIAVLLMVALFKQSLLPGPPGLVFIMFFICGFSEPIFNTTFFSLFFISGFINIGNFIALPKIKVGNNG